jgi:hypothetical protein
MSGMPGSRTGLALAMAVLIATAAGPAGLSAARQNPDAAQSLTLDDLLTAYRGGDSSVVERALTRPRDFQGLTQRPNPKLDDWLKGWDRGKAVLLLDVAQVAFRVAPNYAPAFIDAGRRAVVAASSGPAAADEMAFAVTWHRAALGMIEGNGNAALLENFVDALKGTSIGRPPNGPLAGRLLLAHAVAAERRCWDARPSLHQPGIRLEELAEAAGARVPADLDFPPPVGKAELDAHQRCLREAFPRFEAAASVPDVHAEAHVRGGWILFQLARPEDALKWLDAATPGDDRQLAYWLNLFRGRVLGGLSRTQESADAYRAALRLYPGAQSAALGLALQLVRLYRADEADEIALAARRSSAPDPWSDYPRADRRFTAGCFLQLREAFQ